MAIKFSKSENNFKAKFLESLEKYRNSLNGSCRTRLIPDDLTQKDLVMHLYKRKFLDIQNDPNSRDLLKRASKLFNIPINPPKDQPTPPESPSPESSQVEYKNLGRILMSIQEEHSKAPANGSVRVTPATLPGSRMGGSKRADPETRDRLDELERNHDRQVGAHLNLMINQATSLKSVAVGAGRSGLKIQLAKGLSRSTKRRRKLTEPERLKQEFMRRYQLTQKDLVNVVFDRMKCDLEMISYLGKSLEEFLVDSKVVSQVYKALPSPGEPKGARRLEFPEVFDEKGKRLKSEFAFLDAGFELEKKPKTEKKVKLEEQKGCKKEEKKTETKQARAKRERPPEETRRCASVKIENKLKKRQEEEREKRRVRTRAKKRVEQRRQQELMDNLSMLPLNQTSVNTGVYMVHCDEFVKTTRKDAQAKEETKRVEPRVEAKPEESLKKEETLSYTERLKNEIFGKADEDSSSGRSPGANPRFQLGLFVFGEYPRTAEKKDQKRALEKAIRVLQRRARKRRDEAEKRRTAGQNGKEQSQKGSAGGEHARADSRARAGREVA